MYVRFILPAAAVVLALGMATGSYAQGSSSTQMRPAQAPQAGPCDDLLRAVEIDMPGAVGARVAAAERDIRDAQELCNSGRPEEGRTLLRGVLSSVHDTE
jgi:hypothetical protein